MIRNVARSATKRIAQYPVTLAGKGCNCHLPTLTCTRYMTDETFGHEGITASIQDPMPALALAYDYEYDEPGNDSQESMISHNGSISSELKSLSLHCRQYSTTLGSGSGGGGTRGGNGGKHKCPKCGNSVTFKHTDFEENTFYCASCSGWFLVKNSGGNAEVSQPVVPHGHGSGGGYLEFKDATEYSGEENGGSTRRLSQSQIIMQHVSTNLPPLPYLQICSSS